MAFPPGDTTILATFKGADSAKLGASFVNGGPQQLVETSLGLSVSANDGGGFILDDVSGDFIRIFTISATGGGYVAYGYRATSSRWYQLNLIGTNWVLRRHDQDGSNHDLATLGVGSSIGPNQKFGIKVVGDQHEVYMYSNGGWDDVPIMSATDGTYTDGQVWFELGNSGVAVTDYALGSLSAPVSAVTIHVDADHPNASDAYNRTQASNPSTPLRTPQAGCMLARATPIWADTIKVTPSTLGNADPINAKDPNMYPAVDHRFTNRSSNALGWPYGDNSGNLPITLSGDIATGTRPKIFKFNVRGVENWKIQNIQFGYDTTTYAERVAGTGFDYSTLGNFERCTDLVWENCLFTGGMGIYRYWAGTHIINNCVIHSPLPPSGGSSGEHDGAGLRMENAPNDSDGIGAPLSVGKLIITNTEFSNIRGDDACTIGGVLPSDPFWDVLEVTIDNCLFWNVNEGGVGGNDTFHCDAIQILGVPKTSVTNSVFIGCSDAFMASDAENGLVVFENNLVVGAGSQFQMQGTDELVMRHNTFYPTTFDRTATLMFFTRYPLTRRGDGKTKLTLLNNILGGIYMRDGTISAYFSSESITTNNLFFATPGLVTPFGSNLPGIPEFGHSARLDTIPNVTIVQGTLARTWELSNTPVVSPGIGQALVTDIAYDRLGRPRGPQPDVGCHQSLEIVPVTPIARAPYVLSRSPVDGTTGVDPNTSISAVLYPKPGIGLDLTKVTTSNVYILDPGGKVIPSSSLTVNENAGKYTINLVPNGDLYPYVVYTVRIEQTVSDTDGSQLEVPAVWSFRVAGPSTPAIYPDGGPASSGGWVLGIS